MAENKWVTGGITLLIEVAALLIYNWLAVHLVRGISFSRDPFFMTLVLFDFGAQHILPKQPLCY